jgi:D-inositol-3-phosphate glycosyltransferase
MPRARIAVVSLHTSPLDPPGTGDSGGMNVYIRTLAEHLGERGVAVDVYTRAAGRPVPQVERAAPLFRVIQVEAGPPAPVPKDALSDLMPRFVEGLLRHEAPPYDLVHAHYWLSGWPARAARARWGTPLVASFHTLGRVKSSAAGPEDAPEPQVRIQWERCLIHDADRILAPTREEAGHLQQLYRARPDRIRVVSPGVDPRRFHPRPRSEARSRLGLPSGPLALFAGRLQPHKGPDVAVRAVGAATRLAPGLDLRLVVVGGPSGARSDEVDRLRAVAREQGIPDRVTFLPAMPHDELRDAYAAADVVIMPSRSESFGLVALEAQACGVPVVAAAVGGLRVAVADGRSGFLVEGHQPGDYAEPILRIISDQALTNRLKAGAVDHAARFPWEGTVDGVLDVYAELLPALRWADDLVAAP